MSKITKVLNQENISLVLLIKIVIFQMKNNLFE